MQVNNDVSVRDGIRNILFISFTLNGIGKPNPGEVFSLYFPQSSYLFLLCEFLLFFTFNFKFIFYLNSKNIYLFSFFIRN